jgi:hypothetical protein
MQDDSDHTRQRWGTSEMTVQTTAYKDRKVARNFSDIAQQHLIFHRF